MARNDIVLLDGILDQRLAERNPSGQLDEVFEYFAFEQVLKDWDLSKDEIDSGWVDGRDDGGIDGFFTFVNGHLLQDASTFVWPKRNASLEVVIVTAKHHATFQQAPINSLLATLPEVLDLGRQQTGLKGSYSASLLDARDLFHAAYRKLAATTPALTFRVVYASRGEQGELGENVVARAKQVEALVSELFSSAACIFHFVGATDLIALYRRTKKFALSLPFVEYLSRSGDSYVVLTKLSEYAAFVTDEKGRLRRYLFDSNVRDFLGDNRVNEDIAQSLRDGSGPEFWWLNNGVTILATAATVLGKTIQLQDVQIVNGLQTTESIFNHFSQSLASGEKGLLVKVVVSTEAAIRDQIIRATNNQSLVEPQSLHATDKIQRDIEDILEKSNWFYERRKNYYRNVGKPPARFVTPMYIAAGYVGLIMRNPAAAARLKSKFMRKPKAYATVFSEHTPISVWPAIVEVLKRTEAVLERVRPSGGKGERFLMRARNVLALATVSRILGTFSYSIEDFVALDKSKLTDEALTETWRVIEPVRRQGKRDDGTPSAKLACEAVARHFRVAGIERIGVQHLPTGDHHERMKTIVLDEPFIAAVNRALPPQPWKPGTHVEVAKLLGVSRARLQAAIHVLIKRGMRYAQRDGIMYDGSGKPISTDPDRTV